jgi:DNA polymerase II large subunit
MDRIEIETDDDMHNVVVTLPGGTRFVMACEDEEHAKELQDQLKRCSWFQLVNLAGA